MPGAPQPWEEKKRLRAEYAAALDKLRDATTMLQRAQYGLEFLDALEKTRQARTKHDNARLALEDHRTAHGCYDSYVPSRREDLGPGCQRAKRWSTPNGKGL